MEVISRDQKKTKNFKLKEKRWRVEIISGYIIMRFKEKILKLLKEKYISHMKEQKSDDIWFLCRNTDARR